MLSEGSRCDGSAYRRGISKMDMEIPAKLFWCSYLKARAIGTKFMEISRCMNPTPIIYSLLKRCLRYVTEDSLYTSLSPPVITTRHLLSRPQIPSPESYPSLERLQLHKYFRVSTSLRTLTFRELFEAPRQSFGSPFLRPRSSSKA